MPCKWRPGDDAPRPRRSFTRSEAPNTSVDLRAPVRDAGLLGSMGRVASVDNTIIESFWSTMQHELLDTRAWQRPGNSFRRSLNESKPGAAHAAGKARSGCHSHTSLRSYTPAPQLRLETPHPRCQLNRVRFPKKGLIMEEYLQLITEQNAVIITLLESINSELNWVEDLSPGSRLLAELGTLNSSLSALELDVSSIESNVS